MRVKQLLLPLTVVLCYLTSSCNFGELTDTIIVPEVETEFYVDLWENLGAPGEGVTFKFLTIKEEACENYEIIYQYTRTGNRLRISLDRIQPPEDCDPGMAPARAAVPTGNLTSGFFDLDIALRNTVTNEGQLTVNSDRYLITMDDPAGIVFLHKELRRIPAGTVWGYVHYPAPADAALAQQFLAELSPYFNYRELQNGYYGHFTIQESGELFLREQPADTETLTFAFDLPGGNRPAILDLIETYRNEYGDRLEIELRTWEGEVW